MQKVKSELCSTSVCDYFQCPTFLKIFQSFQEGVGQLVRRDHCPYRPSISGRCRRHPRKVCYFIVNGHIQVKRQKRLTKVTLHFLCVHSIRSRILKRLGIKFFQIQGLPRRSYQLDTQLCAQVDTYYTDPLGHKLAKIPMIDFCTILLASVSV